MCESGLVLTALIRQLPPMSGWSRTGPDRTYTTTHADGGTEPRSKRGNPAESGAHLSPLLRKEGEIIVIARSVAAKQSLINNVRVRIHPDRQPCPNGVRTSPDCHIKVKLKTPLEEAFRKLV